MDMTSPFDCAFGQVYGNMTEGVTRLGLKTDAEIEEHGFDIPRFETIDGNDEAEYCRLCQELKAAWVPLIVERQARIKIAA